MSFLQRNIPRPPLDYVTPSFPSLYWPIPIFGAQAQFLYNLEDVWLFTLIWTLIFFGAVHMAVCAWAVVVQRHNWKVIWIVPVVFAIIGGIEALISGSILGGLLGAIYQAGYFRISTWIPFVWAFISTLVLILSSFAIQGGL